MFWDLMTTMCLIGMKMLYFRPALILVTFTYLLQESLCAVGVGNKGQEEWHEFQLAGETLLRSSENAYNFFCLRERRRK